jgi:beta-galactosidase/beta-glucuronidase
MTRKRFNLNRRWRFLRDDLPDARDPGFDDSSWQPIGLPHTFDLPYFRTPEFYVGVGWYRKRFTLPARARDTCWSLEFDGVFQVADIFVNNVPVGSHRGGYTGFAIEITNALIPGENTIAIRVSNEWNPQVAPRAGEHIFSGGIYRDVCLLATDPLFVTWNGISITTKRLLPESARVKIVTEIANHSRDCRELTLRTTVFDPHGDVATAAISTQRVDAGGVYEIAQVLDPIGNPKLWHPDHPHLYRTRTQLYNGTFLCDEIETPFGIRSIEWTADRGFFLNGEHLYLRGANVHQDHAGWGIGITRAACERDVRLIKEAGFNFIRGAHYPHHPAFADACDRLGVLFWSENAFWGKGGFGPEGYWNASAYPVEPADFEPFEQSCRDQLREMIRINRNHPSVIAWSMCNEPFFTFHLDRARALLSDLVRLSRELDPTRPAAIGGAQRGEIDHIGDLAGYNGDGARLFIDPAIANMVSEYGAISKPHDSYAPFFGELQPERFPWRSGEAIWCGFDYGSIAGRQGLKGILNHQRLPKQSWHWYRNHNLAASALASTGPASAPAAREGIPAMLRLDADKTTLAGTDATDDAQIIVTICDEAGVHTSNCPQVTLTIESGPGEFPTGRSITFSPDSDITITDGQAAIAFRSYHGGESLIRATSPGLTEATIVITTIDHKP